MPLIGARELRENTAEVLRRVREEGAEYIVTVHRTSLVTRDRQQLEHLASVVHTLTPVQATAHIEKE